VARLSQAMLPQQQILQTIQRVAHGHQGRLIALSLD